MSQSARPAKGASTTTTESLLDTPITPPLQARKSRDHASRDALLNPFSDPRQRARSSSAVGHSTPAHSAPRRSASNAHSKHRSTNSRDAKPLEYMKSHNRSANRTHRRGKSLSDPIDALDTIGGGYHHDGPYEATLASRNRNPKYAPLNAVRDSNNEALRATPREFIEDSLRLHVPLQGVATIPAGMTHGDQFMDYKEGADLMREEDAEGGAYKRWEGVKYHPDDLKGKGEPSYTYERDQAWKGKGLLEPEGIELRPQNRRAHSSGAPSSASTGREGGDIRRSNTTGKKRLSDGLKRRFGVKKDVPAGEVH